MISETVPPHLRAIASHQQSQARRLRSSFSHLSRFVAKLMRSQLSCGPITVQQCYCLEALARTTCSMRELADEVGLHQSTVTRIVEKLERGGWVARGRQTGDRRTVCVALTDAGRELFRCLDEQSNELATALLQLIPNADRGKVLEALETVTAALSLDNPAFREVLAACCDTGQASAGRPT